MEGSGEGTEGTVSGTTEDRRNDVTTWLRSGIRQRTQRRDTHKEHQVNIKGAEETEGTEGTEGTEMIEGTEKTEGLGD